MSEMSQQPNRKRPFPLNVTPIKEGWGIVVYQRDGTLWQLIKPGWQAERKQPYVFPDPEAAWDFVKRVFTFCLNQERLQSVNSNQVSNCEQCRKIFRGRYHYCPECLQENEFLLQQIWQGFYYLTGSDDHAMHKMSSMLKIPMESFDQVPDALGVMAKRHATLSDTQAAIRNQQQTAQPPKSPEDGTGMHRHRLGA